MKKLLRKGFSFRLKPSVDVEARLANYVGAARFLWNKVLALNLARLENKQNLLWYPEMSFWFTLWKKSEEDGFLKEPPSQALQQKLRDLEKAFKDAFDKKQPLKRIPKFKRKGMSDIPCYPQGFKLDEANRRVRPCKPDMSLLHTSSKRESQKPISIHMRELWACSKC